MGRSSELYAAQKERDEAVREASAELLIAGKYLFVKLATLYEAAGANPAECSALRRWAEAVAAVEGPRNRRAS